MATPKYSPEQIEIKFQECESIILDKMWKKCEKGKRLMRHLNFVKCLKKLDSDTYAKIVKLATEQVARRFMGYQNLESIVLGYTKKKFDYRVVDTLPDTTGLSGIVKKFQSSLPEIGQRSFRINISGKLAGWKQKHRLELLW